MSAIGALVARRGQLVHVIVGDDAGRGGDLMHDFRKIGADDLLLRIAGGTQCTYYCVPPAIDSIGLSLPIFWKVRISPRARRRCRRRSGSG